jgi:hypothetical protein
MGAGEREKREREEKKERRERRGEESPPWIADTVRWVTDDNLP